MLASLIRLLLAVSNPPAAPPGFFSPPATPDSSSSSSRYSASKLLIEFALFKFSKGISGVQSTPMSSSSLQFVMLSLLLLWLFDSNAFAILKLFLDLPPVSSSVHIFGRDDCLLFERSGSVCFIRLKLSSHCLELAIVGEEKLP
ncbi:Protein of unknown function [Cotesia congregata]|uniref:Uncharacterized protein n=1 Tax=Cotesia congregata TaxID=51543 RepID=A0A8J2MPA7_COTCN|nr:Protein of unknown function [Cotesia congregata]